MKPRIAFGKIFPVRKLSADDREGEEGGGGGGEGEAEHQHVVRKHRRKFEQSLTLVKNS